MHTTSLPMERRYCQKKQQHLEYYNWAKFQASSNRRGYWPEKIFIRPVGKHGLYERVCTCRRNFPEQMQVEKAGEG